MTVNGTEKCTKQFQRLNSLNIERLTMLFLFVEYTVAFVTWFLARVHPYWKSAEPLVKTVLFVLIQLIITFWTSAFLYLAFYYFYVPDAAFEVPLHFQFDSKCKLGGQSVGVACSFPTANVTLQTPDSKHFAYGQAYKIMIELTMPDSPVNRDTGMFMVSADFYSRAGVVTQSAQRIALMRYRSPLISTLDVVLRSPILLFGAELERQVLRLEMFPSFVDDPYKTTLCALIQVQSPTVQFYSARLLGYAQFSGLKYWLFYHPLISGFIGFGSLFLAWNFFLFVVFLRRLLAGAERGSYPAPPEDDWPEPKPTLKKHSVRPDSPKLDNPKADSPKPETLSDPKAPTDSGPPEQELRQRHPEQS